MHAFAHFHDIPLSPLNSNLKKQFKVSQLICCSTHLMHRNTINYPIPFIFDICLILVRARFHQRLFTLFHFQSISNWIKIIRTLLIGMTLPHFANPLLSYMVNKIVSANQQIY